MEWGKSKTKIPLKIKQTHSLALSPNLTFKTDHFFANSFLVSLKNAPPPHQVPAMSASKMVKYTRQASPQSGREEAGALFSTLPQQWVSSSQQGTFPHEESRRHGSFSSSGQQGLLEEGWMQGLRPYCQYRVSDHQVQKTKCIDGGELGD